MDGFFVSSSLIFFHSDYEGIEIHSRKVFNVAKGKTTITKTEESLGPMVCRLNFHICLVWGWSLTHFT